MARRILVQTGGADMELVELLADNEHELQEILRANPNLIPLDDLGLDGPMLVIGVETTLRSGRADLLGVAPSGDILVVEFKTGPQNSDFRHALAQLLDYGADLWQMDPAALDASARDYLATHAGDAIAPASIRDAAIGLWGGNEAFDPDVFERGLRSRLDDGGFQFVVVAQVITRNMRETIAYLQQTHATGNFHGVELVKFSSGPDGVTAFEGRAVTTPTRRTSTSGAGSLSAILDRVDDLGHRERLRQLADYCQSLGMSHEVGSAGVSIRMRVPDRQEPVTVAWVYPPDVTGWMGLRGLNLGVDIATVRHMTVKAHFDGYVDALRRLSGTPMKRGNLRGVEIGPSELAVVEHEAKDALGALAASVGEEA